MTISFFNLLSVMAVTFVFAAMACAQGAANPASIAAPGPPRITLDEKSVHEGIACYTVVSEYQKGPNKLEVLLPDEYSTHKRYRVVYMLPVKEHLLQ